MHTYTYIHTHIHTHTQSSRKRIAMKKSVRTQMTQNRLYPHLKTYALTKLVRSTHTHTHTHTHEMKSWRIEGSLGITPSVYL